MSLTTSAGLRAWRLDAIKPESFAHMFGCSLDDARTRLARANREFGDVACVRALLDNISAPALAALGVLVDAGGLLEEEVLVDETAEQFDMPAEAVRHGLVTLLAAPLVVPLSSGHRGLVAVVDVAAASVGVLARGLAIRALDEGAVIVAAPDHDDGRELLATCMALYQVEVKLTQSGTVHRTALKRLAKQLGVPEARLEDDVAAAQQIGLVDIDGSDVLRPSLARVTAAAAGRFPHHPVLDGFVRALREAARPMPAAAVDDWMVAARRVDPGASPVATCDLAKLPGIRRGLDGDLEAFEACALPDGVGTTVTPSFEVFVAPEASLLHLVEVLGAADLTRIDRVIVARITKSSIRRAIARGARLDTIIASLQRASRTPLPQNVEAAIADWAGGTAYASTAFGRVIAVPPDAHDRTAAALATLAPQILANGVFVVESGVPASTVTRLLDKAGITERRGGDVTSVDDPTPSAPIAYPPLRTGDRELQRRIAAFQAGDPAERERSPHEHCSCGSRHDDDVFEISDEAIDRAERWERAHEPLTDQQATIFAALCEVVKPVDRDFLLKAKTANDLMHRIEIVMTERDGLADLMRTHRAAFERHLPAMLEELANEPGLEAPPVRPADLDWIRRDLVARLTAAQRTHATLALDLGGRDVRVARILRVAQQGRVAMLLAEDVRDGSSIAIPIAALCGIAQPPAAPATAEPGARGPWRPVEGEPSPPGHVPCPCGSGRRYRACCREASLPS